MKKMEDRVSPSRDKGRVKPSLEVGEAPLSIEDVVAISQGRVGIELSQDKGFVSAIHDSAALVERLIQSGQVVYGVNTGFGDSCSTSIPDELVDALPYHLYAFHGCGLGEPLSEVEARSVLVARLVSLAQGYSGVRMQILAQLVTLLTHNITPVIPQEGSVGASGDLTPLSYVAAVMNGKRDSYYEGERRPTSEVFDALGIAPCTLRIKETLAIMNGTAVMTGLACLAFDRARYLAELATRITALTTAALLGGPRHFDEKLFAAKPHPGQGQIAAWLRADLVDLPPASNGHVQERYSIRCAPHVIGVLQDALPFLRQFIEVELNSANDNPIVDTEGGRILHGGHFYGGHIAFAMDSLKNAVANVADLLDRQLALLVDRRYNNGLPANLSGSSPARAPINHGFKAVQIGVSAWTAEALKLTMPASVFSRSTECHNQDKVSMGTISARDCLRVLQLTEQVTAACLLASAQALELRIQSKALAVPEPLKTTLKEVRAASQRLEEDRPLEVDLRRTVASIQNQTWTTYPVKGGST